MTQLVVRYPCGKRKTQPAANDNGTPELQQQRERLTGRSSTDRRASYPLGVLYARGRIWKGDHYAGRRYAALFATAVRNPLVMPSLLADLVGRGGLRPIYDCGESDAGALARADYLAAREVLDRRGLHIAQAVDDLCVYEIAPRSEKRLAMAQDGLDALYRHFEEVDAARAKDRPATEPANDNGERPRAFRNGVPIA